MSNLDRAYKAFREYVSKYERIHPEDGAESIYIVLFDDGSGYVEQFIYNPTADNLFRTERRRVASWVTTGEAVERIKELLDGIYAIPEER